MRKVHLRGETIFRTGPNLGKEENSGQLLSKRIKINYISLCYLSEKQAKL
jgi:hypothetical protein